MNGRRALIYSRIRENQLNPGDPHIQDSLGWVYFRLGRTQDALDVFRTLWSKSPDTEVGTHYGEVLWHAGQQDAAVGQGAFDEAV